MDWKLARAANHRDPKHLGNSPFSHTLNNHYQPQMHSQSPPPQDKIIQVTNSLFDLTLNFNL